MPRAAHRPNQSESILDAVIEHLREEGVLALSLDSAAKAAGMTKPGLMYHFSTKAVLVSALVDRIVDGHEHELVELLGRAPEEAAAHERHAAYVRWALTTTHDTVELIMLTDPKLWDQMTERWSERLTPWLAVPEGTPESERVRLHAVRLLADGAWFADASGFLPVPAGDRAALLDTALRLLDGGAS